MANLCRYYQPSSIAEAPDAPRSSTANFDQHLQYDDLARPTNFNTQQSFSDTALTAFAQLIALRLVSQRAIVSLIDHENEYFLAESTSTLSLIDDEGPAQNAWLSISGARVPRAASLCEQTLRLVPNQDTTAEMTPWFLVPDLTLDEKMSQLDCVKGPPYLRFYCGVALTNKKGVNIGCVYVVDDRPRTDFSLEQAQFLTRMAATVMDHLENIRAKEDMVRVTMMSQALHAFIEGDGTMDGDWQRLKKYNLPSGAGVGFHWETNKDDGASNYVNGKKQLGAAGSPGALPLFSGPDMDKNHGQSPLQHNANNQDARFNFNNSPWSSSSEIPQVPALKSVFEGAEDAHAKVALDGGRDTEFSNSGFSNLLHTTFSRASNLVREGMEVDGAVFFDAPFRFYQGRSTLETDPRRSDPGGSESSSESDEEEEHSSARPGPRPHVIPSNHRRFADHSRTNTTDPLELRPIPGGASMGIKSDILGFSTQHSSSWNNQMMSSATPFTAIDQSLLTSLVKRYPQGELFVFDQDGPISQPEDADSRGNSQLTITTAVEEKRARHRARKRAEVLRLLSAFPGARQIFFVPLYDSTSGCFIGSFAWSTSWTRIFSIENHLSYLVAFGHSVMSEVSRLNTLSADRAKGDFISNVSHELRSPLHGILASVEFLADTELDAFQRNLVDTVDICGRTLLDTIEHVLDFSKIKKFGQESMQSMGVVADLDISAVIEEVLEGVFAGFEFNGLSSQGLADTTRSRIRDAPTMLQKKSRTSSNDLQFGVSNDLLTVIIDIDFREQWKFPTVPGTWRRLTMNLFGNALKYTRSGYIKIKLEAKPITPINSLRSDSIERSMVTLTICDSGQGMSSEFMKTKLFMPFSQVWILDSNLYI
jgi:signal transduction histidine kinase